MKERLRRSFRAAVFDMDGVIFDTEPVWLEAETELCRRRGKVFPREFAKRLMGVPGRQAMKMVCEHLELAEDPAVLVVELNQIFHDLLPERLTLMPGIIDRLSLLEERRVPKGVATSTEGLLARKMLGRFDLVERFEFILTRDDVTHGKPHPEIYEKACARHGAHPGEVVVWEDSLAGTKSARTAGCFVIALRHELTESVPFDDADLVVDRHDDPRVGEII